MWIILIVIVQLTVTIITEGRYLRHDELTKNYKTFPEINKNKYGRLSDIKIRKRPKVDGVLHSPIRLNLWKSKSGEKLVIPYSFRSDFPDNVRSLVEKAISSMNQKLKCGHDIWVPFTNQDHRVEFIQEDGCWSMLGKDTSEGNKQQISIADGCEYQTTILHEMMHAMGFHHEQNRIDRDKYIKIITENIQEGLASQFEKTSEINIYETNVGYDYMSIMHYELTAFSKNGKPTMEMRNTKQALSLTKEQLNILGNVPELSPKDVKELRMYFGCDKTIVTEAPPTTIAPPTTVKPKIVMTSSVSTSTFGPTTTDETWSTSGSGYTDDEK